MVDSTRSVAERARFRVLLAPARRGAFGLLVMSGTLAAAGISGMMVGRRSGSTVVELVVPPVALMLAALVFFRPHVGIIVVCASPMLAAVLPNVPVAASAANLIGGVAFVGFIVGRGAVAHREDGPPTWQKWRPAEVWGLAFVAWIALSHPAEAWFGVDRNWTFAYVQLWMLMFLADRLLADDAKQRALMVAVIAAGAISALLAVQQGNIGATFETSARAGGLAGGANAAARYFVVALIFLFFLHPRRKALVRMLSIGTAALLVTGLIFTYSRTGFVLLLAAVLLIVAQRAGGRAKAAVGVLAVGALAGALLVPDQYWTHFTDVVSDRGLARHTLDVRGALWEAGLEMWSDAPVTGVGPGQFSVLLDDYASDDLPAAYREIGPHSIVLSLLTESGLIGTMLFGGMIVSALSGMIRAQRQLPPGTRELSRAWLIVLVVILVGGLTKNDEYDKLLWVSLGVSGSFSARAMTRRTEHLEDVRVRAVASGMPPLSAHD